MKEIHFESLWEECEIVSSQAPFNQDGTIAKINQKLEQLGTCQKEQYKTIFGQILFELCRLSYRLDVNTFTALQQAVMDEKVALLEPEGTKSA